MNQLTMEPKVCLKKIDREELANRARLGFLNPLDCPPAEVEDALSSSVRIRTSGPLQDSVDDKAIKIGPQGRDPDHKTSSRKKKY